VRLIGVDLDADEQAYVRRKLGMKLGKFATSIERISVRVTDMNGPRGGVDQLCNVKVVLSGLPSVVIQRRHTALHAAIDDALRATERAVRRSVGRRHMKPLRGRNSTTGISAW
jgi:ribosome-associated translation inhibitor RaiA